VAVAGDDDAEKKITMAIVNEVGFDPVDGGLLAESWRQQPLTPGYCCDYDAPTMRKALDAAVKGEAPTRWSIFESKIAALGPDSTHAGRVAMNRLFVPLQ
jgi:hypothetical protein